MADKSHKHFHHGRSSKDILSANEVLDKAGLNKGDVFLDAGCGDGFISLAASSVVGAEGKVYALDAYPESIEHLKKDIEAKSIKNMETVTADITDRIPLEDDSIDLCVMANVLHGFVADGSVEEALNEIGRVIKPGGIFAVVEFKKIEGTPGPPFKVRITPATVEDLVTFYGFEVRETVEVGQYHYLVRAFKE